MLLVGNREVTKDNWKGVFPKLTAIEGVQEYNPGNLEAIPGLKLDKPWPAMAINQQTAEEAYNSVLEHAGASLPERDAVDFELLTKFALHMQLLKAHLTKRNIRLLI